MANFKNIDLAGQEKGDLLIKDELLQWDVNHQLVKDYLVAVLANRRQWSAHTKTRAEVSHSGQKPHPQKGTGRARQGYLGAPQYKGGGRVGGPRAKGDVRVELNLKEKRAVVRHLLAEKLSNGRCHMLELPQMAVPSTRQVVAFLKKLGLNASKVLFVGQKGELAQATPWIKSLRNLPNVKVSLLANVSGYDLASYEHLVVVGSAFDHMVTMLEGSAHGA